MTERNYWVLCDDNCRFPGMTREQIYDAIAEATGMTPTPVDEAFITMIKEQNANHNIKFWHGTEAQFNALEETDSDTVYVIGTNKVKSVDALEAAVSELQEEVQPVERGGTGATSAAQARTNLGLHGAETRTLLWTNASPSSAFAAQTLTFDLSEYDAVEIIYKEADGYSGIGSITRRHTINGVSNPMFANTNRCFTRSVTVSTNGVTFAGAIYYTSYGGSSTATENSFFVPMKIYGIREV